MNHPITSSSRRESYKFSPTSRMNNTYIAPGKSTVKEIWEAQNIKSDVRTLKVEEQGAVVF